MEKKLSDAKQKKNVKNLLEAFKALGDSISCVSHITVKGENNFFDGFDEVEITLGLGTRNPYIQIECEKEDIKKYKSFGLQQKYFMDGALIEFENLSDYQRKKVNLKVKPVGLEKHMIISLINI